MKTKTSISLDATLLRSVVEESNVSAFEGFGSTSHRLYFNAHGSHLIEDMVVSPEGERSPNGFVASKKGGFYELNELDLQEPIAYTIACDMLFRTFAPHGITMIFADLEVVQPTSVLRLFEIKYSVSDRPTETHFIATLKI